MAAQKPAIYLPPINDTTHHIRAVLDDGTLHVLAKDIDEALGKPGHGHTLTGVPAQERKYYYLTPRHLKEGEKNTKAATLTVPVLRARIEKMRALKGNEKEMMLKWVNLIGEEIALRNDMLWVPTTPDGWVPHRATVKREGEMWVYACKTPGCQLVGQAHFYPQALKIAQSHAQENAFYESAQTGFHGNDVVLGESYAA